jgi:hypothetical protein
MVEGRQCRGGCDAISGSDAFDILQRFIRLMSLTVPSTTGPKIASLKKDR